MFLAHSQAKGFDERSELDISPVTKLYPRFILLSGAVNVSIAKDAYGMVKIVPGQTLRKYQGNRVMACERDYILIARRINI